MEEENKNHSKKIFFAILLAIVIAGLVSGYWFLYKKTDVAGNRSSDAYADTHTKAYYESLSGSNPSSLQELFALDIKNGMNDKFTKSDAYFITHRYFDNGGNIYEIYDYVNSHPELVFLKDAEQFYPDTFERIKKRSLPATYSGPAMHAYLAYLGALERYGYAGIAARATAANQYVKLAYLIKKTPEQFSPDSGVDVPRYLEAEIKRSVYFATKAKEDVAKILDGKLTSEDITDRDIVVGLNQYASALRYYKYLGIDFDSPKTAREIFAFSTGYANSFVTELVVFTGLLNASTLLLDDSSSVDEVKTALLPVLRIDTSKNTPRARSVPGKIIKSKSEEIAYFSGTQVKDINYDIYGKTNIVGLARKVSEFKVWLLSNGWVEADFQ